MSADGRITLEEVDAFMAQGDRLLESLREERRTLVARIAEIDAHLDLYGSPKGPGPAPGTQAARVVDFVTQHPGCTAKEIESEIPNSRTVPSHLVTQRRLLSRVRPQGGGPWRYYPLVPVRTKPIGETDGG